MTAPEYSPPPPDRWLFLRITGAVLLVMLLISVWVRSYTQEVSLPRYCDDPQGTLAHLQRVLHEPRPAGDGSRLPYIIAAKLLFLLPQGPEETESAYLARVQAYLADTCR